MKKAFKIIGICMASIIGLIGVAIAIIAIQRGGFGASKTKITSLQFDQSTMLVVDDFTANISFAPANANDLTVKLKVEKGENIIEEIPSVVKAGTPFTIKVKKDASGNNIGGEIKIKAIYDNMIPASNELNVLVDVAIPTDGLIMWADTSDEIIAQTQPFDLFVFTNPNLAINPNTGEIPDLLKEYKNITITSSNPGSLEILNDGKGVADYGVIPGYDNVRRKYIKYRINPKVKSEGEVYLYSKAFRTYFMEDDYVNQSDYTDNLEYYAALSAYIEKYKTYFVNDTRPYKNENGTIIFENGNAFINSTLNNGVVDIKPNDNTENKINAANYYMYVDVTNVYNIISVSIKEIQLKNTTPLEMNLHTEVWEFDKKELKEFFGINIIATSDEYDESTLDARINEIKIMPIRNNVDDTDGFPNYDLATDVFEITNPTNLATPVWTIRAKNPILNSRDGTRLRFYLTEKDETNVDNEGNPTIKIISADMAVNVTNNEVTDFKLNALPVSALCLNDKGGLNGEVKTTILNKDSYVIQGVNPTYTTVKFFVTRDSATYSSANGSFFKLKLNKDGSKPTSLNMPVMKLATETPETIQAYEINNNNGINTILEALNVTGSAPVEIFAAIVKTDYNGNPIYGEDGKTYTIVKKSNTQTLDVVNYLEKLNIYTTFEKIETDGNVSREFYKRNVGGFVMPDRTTYPEYAGTDDATNAKWAEFVQEETRKHETVKLLANENYKFYLTNLELNKDGSFNKDSFEYKNKDIDYLTNLNSALKNVRDSKNLKFGVDSTDGEDYVALNTSAGEATDEIINGISFVVVDLSTIKATKNNLPSFYADFANASAIQTIKEYSQTKLSISFSDVTEGNILTSVSDITQDNIEITAVASTGKVSWISNTKDFYLGKEPDSTDINNYFEMLLDIGAFSQNDAIYTSNKIDFSYNTQTNVEKYMDNIKNKNNMKFSWSVREQDKDFVVIGDPNGIPTLAIKKGLKTGAEVKLTCVVSYYPIDGKADEFHKSFSKTVTLKIFQDDINFVSYSNVTANIGGADIDALIENKTKPLEVYGGDSFNLLQKLTTPKKIVRQVSNGFEDTGKTSQRFMRVTLGETNDIIKDCTFEIVDSNGEYLAYFRDDEGNKVYSMKPKLDDNLVIYAEDMKEDRVVRIKITSDLFSSGVTEFNYNILVKSSINISVPLGADNNPVNQSVGIGFGNDNTGNGAIDANDISLDLALNQGSVNRYHVTQRVITSKNLITNQTNYVYKTLPINFEFLYALNYVTMSSKPNYFVVGDNSGEIKSNQIYYENLEGNTNPKILDFVINPVQVPRVYETTLNMYYYVPKIKSVEMNPTGTAGEVTYKYNYETYIDGGVDTHRYIFKKVLVGEIVVKTVNHVNATLSPNLNNDNSILVKSGTEDLNLFNKYGKEATVGGTVGGTTNFIDIKYNGGSENGKHITYYNLATETNYYNNFIKLEFDYSKLNEDNGIISGIDNLTRLANLFGGTHISDEIVQQNLIKIANGEVVTSSVNFDFILRIKVLFLIKDTVDAPITKGTSALFDFKIKFTKSVEFNIGDADYNTSIIPDTDIIVGGHEYTNNQEALNTITLNNKTIKLYDSTVPVNTNIVKIVGGGAGENLTKNNITEINVYKFNKLTNTYEMVPDALNLNANNLNQKLFISWLKNEDGTTSIINLVIVRSVNEEEQYKVELKSTTFNISGDYYFKVLSTFIAKANYPVERLLEKAKQGGSVDLKTNYINPLNRVTILNSTNAQNYSLTTKTEGEQVVNYLVENILDASGNVTYGREIALKNANGNVNNITLWKYAVVEGEAYATVNANTGIVNFLVNTTNDIKNITVRCYIFNGAYIDYKFQVYKTITQYALTVRDGEEDITPSNPLVVYANRELNLLNYITLRDSSSNIVNDQLQIKYVINETTPVAHYKKENAFANQITKNTIINNSNAVVKFEDVASVYGNNINTLLKFDIYTTNSTQNDSQLKTLYIKLLPNIELKQNITILPAGDINKVNLLSADSSNIAGTSNDIFQLSEQSDRQGQLAVKFTNVTYAGTENIPGANILSNIKLTKDLDVITANDMGNAIVIDFTSNTYKLEFSSGNIDKDIIVTFEFNKTFMVNGVNKTYSTSYTVTLKPNINVNFNYSSGKNYKEIESSSISESGRSFTVVSDQNVQLKDYKGQELKDHIIVTYHLKDALGNLLVGHDNPSNDKMMSPIYAFGKDNGIISFNQVNKETTFQVVVKITWYNKLITALDKIAEATYDTVYFIHFMPNIIIPKGIGGIADKSLMVQYKSGESSIANGALPVYAGTTVALDFGEIKEFAKQSGKHIAVNANQNANGVNKPANLVIFKTIENVNNATGPYVISEGENEKQGLITFSGVLNGENDIVSIPLYLDLKGNYAGVIEPDKSADTGNYISPSLMDLYNELGLVLKFKIINSVASIEYADGKNDATVINMKSIIENGTSISGGLARNQFKIITTEYLKFNPIKNNNVPLVTFVKSEETDNTPYVDIDNLINLFTVEFKVLNSTGGEDDGRQYVDYNSKTGVITFKPYTKEVKIITKVSLSTNSSVVIKYNFDVPNKGYVLYSSATDGVIYGQDTNNAIKLDAENSAGVDLSKQILYFYMKDAPVETPSVNGDVNKDEYNEITGILTITRVMGEKKIVYTGYKLETNTFKYTIDVPDNNSKLVGTSLIPTMFYSEDITNTHNVSLKIEVLPGYSAIPMHVEIKPKLIKYEVSVETTLTLNIDGLNKSGYLISPNLTVGENPLAGVTYAYNIDVSLANYLYVNKETNQAYVVDRSKLITLFENFSFKVTATINQANTFVKQVLYNMEPTVLFKTKNIGVTASVKTESKVTVTMVSMDASANNETAHDSAVLINKLPKDEYKIEIRAVDFELNDYFNLTPNTTSVTISTNDSGNLTNNIWELNPRNVQKDENKILKVRLFKLNDANVYFEKDITLTFKANSGILNLQPNYLYTTTYNPTNGVEVPAEIEYSINLDKDGSGGFDIIGAINPADDIKVTISATASNSTVVNSLVSSKYNFANKNILTIVLNNTTLGTDGKPIKLASVDVTFTLSKDEVQISSAESKIQFNWLALTNKTSVYTKEILIPNNETDIKLSINETNPEIVNGGNYLTGIFDSTKALDILNPVENVGGTEQPVTDLTKYNIKFYDKDGVIISPVEVVRDGLTIKTPRLVMDDYGKLTLGVAYNLNAYQRPTKIEFYVVALEKTTDVTRTQVWSVKKKVTINVNYVELTNFEKDLARNYIYSNETTTAAIIGLPEAPFSITSSSGSNYSVSYSITNSEIVGGGEFLASYLSLSESTIPYGDKNVKVLLLNIGKQIGVATNPEITKVTIKAVVSKNTTAVGELTSIISLNRRDVDVNSEYKKKEVVYDIEGTDVVGSNKNTTTIVLDKAMGDVLDENYKIKVTDTVGGIETEIESYSYDIQVTNVTSNGSSLALDSVEFSVNLAGKLVCVVKSNTSGSTPVLYKPTAINIILKIIENGIPVYAYSISVGIAWAS